MLTVIYDIICYSHGDFSPEHLGKADWLPCISEIDGFAATFLFLFLKADLLETCKFD